MAKDPAQRPGIEDFLADLERSAAEGYGAGWEERGRRRLAELTALLALLFPFTATATLEAPAQALTLLGRLKRGGWKAAAGAAVLAVVAGGLTSVAARPHDTSTTVASSVPSDVGSPTPSAPSPSASATGASASPTADTTPTGTPSDSPTVSPTPTVSSAPPAESPTPTTASPATPTPGTVTITIGSWQRGQTPGTLVADVTVDTTGTGPVTVTADYYVDTPADPYGNQTRQLSGGTHYPVAFVADFANHPCRGAWTVTLTSTPAAANGPQTASLDAPPC
jgi:serine/threonine-protein kinase